MKSMVKSTRKIFMRILMTILAMCIMLFAAAGCEKEGTAASGTTLPASQTKTAVKVSASVAKTSQAASSVSSATKGTAATSASGAATSENQNNSSGYQNGTGDANETEASDNENMYDESTGDESNGSDIEEKVQIDLGGKNIKISCWADSMIIKEGGTTELTVKRYERLKWVEETYNCKFVWSVLPSATYSDLISAMLMAGSAEYDVCLLTKEKALGPYAVNNLIKPIQEYIDKDSAVWNDQYFGCKLNLFNDKLYGLYNADAGQPLGIFWHRPMLEREGLTDPHDMNTWTWTDLIDMSIKLTQDINGDGIIDQWGIAGNPSEYLGEVLFTSNAVEYLKKTGNKYEVTICDDVKAMNAVYFMSDLYNVYKVITPLNISTGWRWSTLWQNSKAAMAPNYAYNGKTFISRGITDFGWKHFPFGPDNGNQEYHILTSGNFYVFPAANNNTEDMVNVMAKTLALWDTSMPHSITFEEVALSVKQGIFASEKDYPALDHVNAILVKNYAKIFPKLPTTVSSEIYVKAVKQEISVVSAFEAARYLLQSAVDEVQDKW